ncbi:hypothetical protein ANN_27462 [Periplaneta americana]|uniref:Per a allergen n=1 Tax=Periplaneta americana TaxID=6978 RepID=A0ABQ8RVX7_PERAM|nr:hypothetical protein ANN_27462 [Periplaneta americana]
MSLNSIRRTKIDTGVAVKAAKIKDVGDILSAHFGENWDTLPNLKYYKLVVEGPQNNEIDKPDSDFD